jgi:hypothetical protein
VRKNGDYVYRSRIAAEKRAGALDELSKSRFTNVADLALKAVEQAIEACASRQGLHFHTEPKSAHAKRAEWLKLNFPELVESLTALWGIYSALGYGGLNGERARKAVEEMERIVDVLGERSGIRFK